MIRTIEVIGLPRQKGPIVAELHPDLNIITGRNGSGKTTLLKLLWYVISGNIEHALREVPFQRVKIETSDYTIAIARIGGSQCRIEFVKGDQEQLFEDQLDEDSDTIFDAEEAANSAVKDIGSSVFLPTFRRIEGGFSINQSGSPFQMRVQSRARTEIEQALFMLAGRLTVEKHTFVAAISTVDIVNLLMRNYTEMSELSNNLQRDTSQNIINQIMNYKRDSNVTNEMFSSKADVVLDSIRSMIESMDAQRGVIMSPLNAVREVVERLFQHSGIKLGTRLSFGDAATAVSSDMLSAGEKQMLSFICYNAFYKSSVIFIDEPELSLHVDWQRQLFPTLQEQGTSNQFIIATHSPFIYSKYPDKEIMLSEDRGATGLDID